MKFFNPTVAAIVAMSSGGGLFGGGVGIGRAMAMAVASDGEEDWKGAVLTKEFVSGSGMANLAAKGDAKDRHDEGEAVEAIRTVNEKLGHTGGVSAEKGKANLAGGLDAEDHQGEPQVLGDAVKKFVGRLRHSAKTEDSTKLRGAVTEDGGEIGGTVSGDGVQFLTEYEEARAHYAHTYTEHSLKKMHQDYKDSALNGDPEKDLPSYDQVREIFEKMYDSFQQDKVKRAASKTVASQVDSSIAEVQETNPEDELSLSMSMIMDQSLSVYYFDDDDVIRSFENNSTDSTTANGTTEVGEDEALSFVNGRLTANDWSSTFQEVMVCQDMFTGAELGLDIDDEGSLNLSPEDLAAVGEACRHDRHRANLEALGYNPDTFCPLFARMMPLQYQVLGDVITHNVTSFCSFLVDTLFETAGESECARRIEEVQLVDAISLGTRYSFPLITNTSTFKSSYTAVCTDHETPFFYDPQDCASSMESVIQVSTQFEPGNETMISYLSNLCDAFGLPLPHPNETIRVRYDNPHVSHKPGGKPNIKIRHMMSDLFNYVGHYKHGFMNKYGKYIDHPSDTLLDPETEFVASGVDSGVGMTCDEGAKKLNSKMTCDQRNLYCTGLAFSVGVGADVSAGPLSIGGGVDFGFGIQNDQASMYEETFVWGICGSESLPLNEVDNAKAESKKSNTRKKMEANEVSVSVGLSAGGWTNTGHIPGFADTISVSVNILGVEIGFTLIETFAQDFWVQSNGFHGFLLEVGASFPPAGPLSADMDQAKCYGATIVSDKNAATRFPRQYEIDMDARWNSQVCGPNTYSFNIESKTGNDVDSTKTGLSLYYYKNQWDWDNKKNRQYIVHYCGNPLQSNKLTTMGHGNHFVTQKVYGVGIAAHGNDKYNLGFAGLFQAAGGNKWVQKFANNDVNLCVATNSHGCYPNIEIKIEGESSELFWRSGNERVPKANLCPQKPILKMGKYTEQYRDCDWKENTSCGSGQTMRLNQCGTSNKDQVWNIDEKAACQTCAKYLEGRGLFYSDWKCVDKGFHRWNIEYRPVEKYQSVYSHTTCWSGWVTCHGSARVHITRDGRWRQDRVYDIPWGQSWESYADACCRNLRSWGYVSSCNRKHVGVGMDVQYTSTSSCTNHYRNEKITSYTYNVGCSNWMYLSVYNPAGSRNSDTVTNIWRGGCMSCGKYLQDRQLIKSGYDCTEETMGAFLIYTPVAKYASRSTTKEIQMQFDSTWSMHSNTIDGIDNNCSWEGACEQAKTYLQNNKYIESGAYCEKNGNPATSIWLNYKPTIDWYPMSTATGTATDDKYKCDRAIANKNGWCSGSSDKIVYYRCDGKPVNITNPATHLQCNEGGSLTMNCDTMSRSPYCPPPPPSSKCLSGSVKCYGSAKVYISRDGRWHQDKVHDISGSWEKAADECCRFLKKEGAVSYCYKRKKWSGMYLRYKSKSC